MIFVIEKFFQEKETTLIILDGKNLSSIQDVFDLFVKELNLPMYFSNNLNSLDECLADLSWLESSKCINIIIKNYLDLLTEHRSMKKALLEILSNINEEWANSPEEYRLFQVHIFNQIGVKQDLVELNLNYTYINE